MHTYCLPLFVDFFLFNKEFFNNTNFDGRTQVKLVNISTTLMELEQLT